MTTPANVSSLRVWLTAVRPFAYSASVLPVILGAAIAWYLGHPIRWALLAVTFVGVVCFHTGANLLNDCFDHRRGLDRDVLPTSGAVVRGWITEGMAFRVAWALLIAGAVCGFVLVRQAGWVVLLLGAIGAVCAAGYTTGGFCFKYAGLGDAAIFVAFGVLVVFGTFWVQARAFHWLPILWSAPLAMYTVGILHANNWRDVPTDPGRQCRTVASRLGRGGSARYYRLLTMGPFVLVGAFILLGRIPSVGLPTPATAALAFLALPLAARLSRTGPDPEPEPAPLLDSRTAQLHMLFGLLASAGFCIGRHFPGAL
jgi:1,4-dihydroxy-2-naphthoate polyprenyltransferase